MRVSTTTLLTLPALAAAFLLPPNVSPEGLTSVDGAHMGLTLPCVSCIYAADATNPATDLLFDISIPSTRKSLLINNQPIIPFLSRSGLQALQFPTSSPPTSSPLPVKLGFDLLVTGSINADSPQQKEIVVRLRITSVDGARNDNLEELRITVSEDRNSGEMTLVAAERVPIEHYHLPAPPAEIEEPVACEGPRCMFTKLRNKVGGTRKHKGGCHGKHGDRQRYPPHGHGHRHGHHGYQRRPQHHFWSAVVNHVLMPILIGIIAGVSVSVVALVVSQGFMKLWGMVAARRGGRHVVVVVSRCDEEKGLLKNMVEEEELPAYVDEGMEVVEKV